MILWLPEQTMHAMKIDGSCLKKRAETVSFSHDNYFHSVLRLLAIKTSAYEEKTTFSHYASDSNGSSCRQAVLEQRLT